MGPGWRLIGDAGSQPKQLLDQTTKVVVGGYGLDVRVYGSRGDFMGPRTAKTQLTDARADSALDPHLGQADPHIDQAGL